MPKNKGKGGKNRRRGKNENEDLKRELIIREANQGKFARRHFIKSSQFVLCLPFLCEAYAQVTKMLGNGRLEATCFDGSANATRRLCHIRGKLRKKVWINSGDVILVGLREYQDAKADVILKYTPDEARRLMNLNEIPNTSKLNIVFYIFIFTNFF